MEQKNIPPRSLWKRGRGFQKIETPCTQLLSQVFQTKDFLYSKMAQDWLGIVGPELASATRPQRIQVFQNEGTLLVEVDPSGSLWVPTYSATLMDRVNQYMGYKAVQRVTFRKASCVFSSKTKREHVLKDAPPEITLLEDKEVIHARYPTIKDIPNDALSQALSELAQYLR
jgi:hypothetical protein